MTQASKPPTMQDIAFKLGVSKSAVSLALNNKPGVSEQLRQTVLQMAETLGYRSSSRTVGATRPATDPPTVFETNRTTIAVVHQIGYEPYQHMHGLAHEWVNGIRAYLYEVNADLMLIGGYRPNDLSQLADHLFETEHNPLDGLILMGPGLTPDSELLTRARARQLPTAIIGRLWPDLPISAVSQDYREQTAIALQHLQQLGHQHIVFVARDFDVHHDWYHARLDQFTTHMQSVHGVLDHALVVLAADAADAVVKLQTQAPHATAILAVHDEFGAQLLAALNDAGVHIPNDLSVIGQDNTETLTTVGYPHFEMGYAAAETLFKQIKNPTIAYQKTVVRCQLVERDTCRPHTP